MSRERKCIVVAAIVVTLTACQSNEWSDSQQPGNVPVPSDESGDGWTDPTDNEECGGTGFPVVANPPNVMLLLDRSCSMRHRVNDTGFPVDPESNNSRWAKVRRAIELLTAAYPARVRWGLTMFPAFEGCCDDPLSATVTPGFGTGDNVTATLERPRWNPFTHCSPPENRDYGTGRQPHCTPLLQGLEAMASEPSLMDTDRQNLVVLLADGGGDSCGATPETLQAATDALRARGVLTAVVGTGDAVTRAGATANLNAVAQAGGLGLSGATGFYVAHEAAELADALDEIVASAIDCTLDLEGTPPDADELSVYLDELLLERDGADGWTYDLLTNTITLHGAACDALRAGTVERVDAVYGCTERECTPTDEVCDGLDNDCDGDVDEVCVE